MTGEEILKKWPATVQNPNGFSKEVIPEIKYFSYSRLSLFMKSPKHYYSRYIKGVVPKQSDALDEGKVIHKALLEMDDFLSRMKIPPHKSDFKYVTKDDLIILASEHGLTIQKSLTKPKFLDHLKDIDGIRELVYDFALMDFEEGCAEDSLIFDQETADRLINIIKAVGDNPAAVKLIKDGIPEGVAYWYDEEFNVTWIARLDYLKISNNVVWITDLKSTKDASPESYSKDLYNFNYYIQSWIYRRMINGITGMNTRFCHVVVEKEEPFICEVYYVDQQSEEDAYWVAGRKLKKFNNCLKTDHWPGYSDGQINPIGIPNYAKWIIEQMADKELENDGGRSN